MQSSAKEDALKAAEPDTTPNARHHVWMVPTRLVSKVWYIAAPLLNPAVERSGGRHTLSTTLQQLVSGHMQLFLVISAEGAVAAAVTQVLRYPAAKWLVILMCGGRELNTWIKAGIETIEDWARQNDCHGVEIIGRRGWIRALGYEEQTSIMERTLR